MRMKSFYSFIFTFSFLSRRLVTPQACKGGSNILLVFLCVGGFLISNSSIAFAIEVRGHLTEDTTWSPDNNPYHVIDDVFVDDDITLTILPGTIVKFNSTLLETEQNMANFVYYNGANIAKMLQVDGRIIAEGTEEEPILFTRIQDSLYYHWGIIYLTEDADRCSFKNCRFEYAAYLLIVLGIIPYGAISTYNEEVIIEHCEFVDNLCGIHIEGFPQQVLIKDNNFFNVEHFSPSYIGYNLKGGISISIAATSYPDVILVANNEFNEDVSYNYIMNHRAPLYAVYNQFSDDGLHAGNGITKPSYFFKNDFIDCYEGIDGGGLGDSLYIKNNNFYCDYNGVEVHESYVEISDNYFEGCDLDTGLQCSGKVFNNIINDGNVRTSGYLEVYNNIGFAGEDGIIVTYRNEICNNNLSIQNQYAFDGAFSSFFNNCLFIANEEISNNGVSGNPIFRNCILDFEFPPECIDGDGNIWVDSLQAQTLFENIQNGDFHLIEGSPAIDAGFDTLGYYYPFDMDYNHRVWDGDNNGTAIIDIGPYEFGSPAFGGIEGYTYNPITGDPVDYVLLKINNQPGEFTFSDSIGNFEYKLPAGIYDVYAERVFYEEVIEYEVEVFDGQFTKVLIPMIETVDVENIQYSIFNFQLSNYPNPFNPTTTIKFSIPEKSKVELTIYNIKGQKIKTLAHNEFAKGTHSIIWNGDDESGSSVSSGLYLYKLNVEGKTKVVKKCLLLK